MITVDYSFTHLSTLFELDENSPSGLVWKYNRYGGKNNKQILRKAGTPAGGVDIANGGGTYRVWRASVNRQRYQAARVVYVLKHGDIENYKVVDHVDGDGLNNKMCNLVLKTTQENNQNVKLGTKNKTGVVGVFLERDLKYDKDIAYTATWNDVDCTAHRKRFYLQNFKHNYPETFAAAVAFRELKIKELIAHGMSYTPRHGK